MAGFAENAQEMNDEAQLSVSISHISEEKAVALRLQALIQTPFPMRFRYSSPGDPASLGGGEA